MSGGTLNNSGTIKISTGTITMPGTLTAMGSWTFTAANTVPSATYSTLTLSNTSGTDTAAGAIVVNTALTTTSGGTFDMSTYQLTGGFTPTNGGTLKTSNTTNPAIPTGQTWTGTVQFALSTGAQYCPAGTFTTLTFSNTSNTDTVVGAITINGILSSTGNATFQDNVTINSGGTFSDTTGDTTLTFTGGKTVTINSGGQFTITGTNGHTVVLTKTGTGNWNLTMSGSYSITYATVSYSTANTTITPTTSIDGSGGGTNVNWTFAAPNALPTIGTVTITNTSPIVLNAGTTATVTATFAVTDTDGCADIDSGSPVTSAKFYRTDVTTLGYDCTVNNTTNCYSMSCTKGSCTGGVANYSCTAPVQYYADATDSGSPHAATNWTVYALPADNAGANAAGSSTGTAEMGSLTAITVTQTSISYGAMALGTTTDLQTPHDQTTEIINKGNRQIDAEVKSNAATAMTCAVGAVPLGTVPLADEGYTLVSNSTVFASLTSITGSYVQLTGFGLNSTTDGSDSKKNIYWGMQLPASGVGSSCTGTLLFTSVNH